MTLLYALVGVPVGGIVGYGGSRLLGVKDTPQAIMTFCGAVGGILGGAKSGLLGGAVGGLLGGSFAYLAIKRDEQNRIN